MVNSDTLRNKEVINICDGNSLGFVCDVEINLREGRIEGIVVPGQKSFFSFFDKQEEQIVIKWQDIRTVGEDVILVEIPPIFDDRC